MAGSVLGLKAKLGVETDDSQIDRSVSSLKEKVTEAAEAEMEADVSTLKSNIKQGIEEAVDEAKWLPDVDFGESVEAMSDEYDKERLNYHIESLGGTSQMPDRLGRAPGAAEDGSMMGELFSGMKGAGGKFLKVGLAGAVGVGILGAVSTLADASPRLNKVMNQLFRSVQLFLRPVGDLAGRLLQDDVGALLKMASKFNSIYNEKGLLVAIGALGKDIATRQGEAGMGETAGRVLGLGAGGIGGAWAGAKGGAAAGGALGSVIPGAGTAAGAAVGGVGGAIGGGILGLKGGGALGRVSEDVTSWLQDNWPGWPDFIPSVDWDRLIGAQIGGDDIAQYIGDRIPEFDWPSFSTEDTVTAIARSVPSFTWPVLNSIHLIEVLEDHTEVLDWDIPSSSDLVDMSTDFVEDLDWNIPTISDVVDGLKDRVQYLSWNVPSLWDVQNMIEDKIPRLRWPSSSRVASAIGSAAARRINMSDLEDGGGVSVGSPFATGGVVNSPTQALVGEAGPEVIAPFDEFREMMSRERRRGPGGGGGGSSGGSDVEAKLDTLIREIKRMGGDTVIEVDGKELMRAQRKAKKRHSSSSTINL